MQTCVISRVVVRSLDVGGELVFQIEFLAAEAPFDHRILIVFGFHVILKTFMSRESGGAE